MSGLKALQKLASEQNATAIANATNRSQENPSPVRGRVFSEIEKYFIERCSRDIDFVQSQMDKARYIIRQGVPADCWQIPLMILGAPDDGRHPPLPEGTSWIDIAKDADVQFAIKLYYRSILEPGTGIGFYTRASRDERPDQVFMKIYFEKRLTSQNY